jgi:hypothetical protein
MIIVTSGSFQPFEYFTSSVKTELKYSIFIPNGYEKGVAAFRAIGTNEPIIQRISITE